MEEVVYVSADGEFIREAYARRAVGGQLPECIRIAHVTSSPGADPITYGYKEFRAKRFHSSREEITNRLIACHLPEHPNPRRFPAVEFFVTGMFDFPSYEWSPVARNGGNQWCYLVTSGDRSDLHEFARTIGLTRLDFVEDEHLWRYDLTHGVRQQAITHGAQEVSHEDLRAILRRRDGMRL